MIFVIIVKMVLNYGDEEETFSSDLGKIEM
jgi:hypothetical protein